MQVQKALQVSSGHRVEFGNATWHNGCFSLRDRWDTANGGFSPRSSSEIPVESFEALIKIGADNDAFTTAAAAAMIAALAEMIKKRHP